MRFFAHSVEGADDAQWQTLPEHRDAVSALAAAFAQPFNAGNAARLSGLLHDLGKYNPAFQLYIRDAGIEGPDHATAGAAVLLKAAETASPGDKMMLCSLLPTPLRGIRRHAGPYTTG